MYDDLSHTHTPGRVGMTIPCFEVICVPGAVSGAGLASMTVSVAVCVARVVEIAVVFFLLCPHHFTLEKLTTSYLHRRKIMPKTLASTVVVMRNEE